ncbi:MAG TPA: protein translocase subunit SecD [Candidatus Microbacterium stercoravium]|uniref:Protein translocase subunit SecD n=1 Tax=Candidatus Microbacterium stercoravium TaxID=2838697 RepID=A0A9D2H688_9MICO|nr:protein translocase subunit SecD [Candidatus Microbacterium stercoravium]
MAISTPTRHAWRALIGLLGLTLILFGANALGVHVFKEGTWVPELALDLQGGTQIVMEADTDGATPTSEQMNQAVEIIRQRVDASGVSEAQITTQGSDHLVVALPGNPDDAQRERIEASAQMQLRPVLYATTSATSFVGEDGESTPYPTPAATLAAEPTADPTDPSDLNWVTEKMQAELLAYDCTSDENDPAHAAHDQPLITCDADGGAKYILGPVEIDGSEIVDAQAGINQDNGSWIVSIDFDKSAPKGELSGAEKFSEISQRLVTYTGAQNQFAFVLDGNVISAPGMNQVITGGSAQISGGGINEESAKVLADQLRFGALPMSFNVVSSDTISATLGSQQLMIGLVAGLIGLLLVAAWVLLVSYRALGFVIIASLAVMAILTFVMLCLLSWRIDYRLSLAGVAGLIVTIGFTADSFIVYFERIRDELRDGKSPFAAVEDGWSRAKRTIFSAKSINVLAAVVLYIMADATVKGFAFTLGLTTLIDIVIFVLFTHPVMQLLVRTRFFGGGHPLSGLDPSALGAVHTSRTSFRSPAAAKGRAQRSRGEAVKRQTIAERKLEEQRRALAGDTKTTQTEGDD